LHIGYLINASSTGSNIKLKLYDPSIDAIEEISCDSYKPYFFLPHPLSKQDQEIVRSLGGEIEVVKKLTCIQMSLEN
jgi:hypothetical protein